MISREQFGNRLCAARLRWICGLVSITALACPVAAEDLTRYDGGWSGTFDRGGTMSFGITESRLTSLGYNINVKDGDEVVEVSSSSSYSSDTGPKITGGSLRMTGSESLTIQFRGKDRASGVLHPNKNTFKGAGLSFTATRQVAAGKDSDPNVRGTSLRVPQGKFFLVRNGTEYGAIRLTFPISKGGGGYQYVWFYQNDGSGDFRRKNVQTGTGKATWPTMDVPGTPFVACGPLRLDWSEGNWIRPPDGVQIAVTGETDVRRLNPGDEVLTWHPKQDTNAPPSTVKSVDAKEKARAEKEERLAEKLRREKKVVEEPPVGQN